MEALVANKLKVKVHEENREQGKTWSSSPSHTGILKQTAPGNAVTLRRFQGQQLTTWKNNVGTCGTQFPVFSVLMQPSSRAGSGCAETPAETTLPCSSLCLCPVEWHCAETAKAASMQMQGTVAQLRVCAAWLFPASARAECLWLAEHLPSRAQQLPLLPPACPRCAAHSRLIPWQLLHRRHNERLSMIRFGALCHLPQH